MILSFLVFPPCFDILCLIMKGAATQRVLRNTDVVGMKQTDSDSSDGRELIGIDCHSFERLGRLSFSYEGLSAYLSCKYREFSPGGAGVI